MSGSRETKLSGALSAVNAAVANLAVWFALHILFHQTVPVRGFAMSLDAPVFGSIDPWPLTLAVVAGMSLFDFKLGVMPTLAICSAASITLYFVLGAVG